MILELGLIGLLATTPPDATLHRAPEIIRPYALVKAGSAFLNYETDLENGSTRRFKMQLGYDFTNNIGAGFESRKFGNTSYGGDADYIFIKLNFKIDDGL